MLGLIGEFDRNRFTISGALTTLRQVALDAALIDSANEGIPSAKLESFRELLEEAADDGHRLLVFSQFTSLLALLREELKAQGLAYCYLDGSIPGSASGRDRPVPGRGGPVFLLSLKAGGSGLNLTAADTVVLDPWWNPAAEAQATDRAHRIGQTRVVTGYKLVAPARSRRR